MKESHWEFIVGLINLGLIVFILIAIFHFVIKFW